MCTVYIGNEEEKYVNRNCKWKKRLPEAIVIRQTLFKFIDIIQGLNRAVHSNTTYLFYSLHDIYFYLNFAVPLRVLDLYLSSSEFDKVNISVISYGHYLLNIYNVIYLVI